MFVLNSYFFMGRDEEMYIVNFLLEIHSNGYKQIAKINRIYYECRCRTEFWSQCLKVNPHYSSWLQHQGIILGTKQLLYPKWEQAFVNIYPTNSALNSLSDSFDALPVPGHPSEFPVFLCFHWVDTVVMNPL